MAKSTLSSPSPEVVSSPETVPAPGTAMVRRLVRAPRKSGGPPGRSGPQASLPTNRAQPPTVVSGASPGGADHRGSEQRRYWTLADESRHLIRSALGQEPLTQMAGRLRRYASHPARGLARLFREAPHRLRGRSGGGALATTLPASGLRSGVRAWSRGVLAVGRPCWSGTAFALIAAHCRPPCTGPHANVLVASGSQGEPHCGDLPTQAMATTRSGHTR